MHLNSPTNPNSFHSLPISQFHLTSILSPCFKVPNLYPPLVSSMARRVLDDLDVHETVPYKPVPNCTQECPLPLPLPLPLPPSGKYHMPAYFIFMLCLLGAAFVFLCYVTILKRYRLSLWISRRTTPPPVEESREDFMDGDQSQVVDHPIWYIRTVGLPDSVIESISVFKYKTGEGLTEGTDCSVCLTEFQEDESLRLLPKCSHAFHIPCIDTWLRSHKNCPMCRAPIISETTNVVEQANNDVAITDQETEVEVNNSENHQESEEVNPEIRPPMESNIEAGNHKGIRVQSDLGEHRVNVDENENFQPPRRSVSASMIRLSTAEIEAAKRNLEIGSSKPSASSSASRSSRWYSAMKSSSFGRSLQKVPIGMKRSSSTSLPTTNSRSQDF